MKHPLLFLAAFVLLAACDTGVESRRHADGLLAKVQPQPRRAGRGRGGELFKGHDGHGLPVGLARARVKVQSFVRV